MFQRVAKICSKWTKSLYFLELISGKFPPFLFSLRPAHHSYFKQAIIIHSHRLIHGRFVQQPQGIAFTEEYTRTLGENESVTVNRAPGPLEAQSEKRHEGEWVDVDVKSCICVQKH